LSFNSNASLLILFIVKKYVPVDDNVNGVVNTISVIVSSVNDIAFYKVKSVFGFECSDDFNIYKEEKKLVQLNTE